MVFREFDRCGGDGSLISSGEYSWFDMRKRDDADSEYGDTYEPEAFFPGNASPEGEEREEARCEKKSEKRGNDSGGENAAHRKDDQKKRENDNPASEGQNGVSAEECEEMSVHRSMVAVFRLFFHPGSICSRMMNAIQYMKQI